MESYGLTKIWHNIDASECQLKELELKTSAKVNTVIMNWCPKCKVNISHNTNKSFTWICKWCWRSNFLKI